MSTFLNFETLCGCEYKKNDTLHKRYARRHVDIKVPPPLEMLIVRFFHENDKRENGELKVVTAPQSGVMANRDDSCRFSITQLSSV